MVTGSVRNPPHVGGVSQNSREESTNLHDCTLAWRVHINQSLMWGNQGRKEKDEPDSPGPGHRGIHGQKNVSQSTPNVPNFNSEPDEWKRRSNYNAKGIRT